MKAWQRWGLVAASFSVLLRVVILALDRVGWYQVTIWLQGFAVANYPAGELSRHILNYLHVPRIYDGSVTWREFLIINLAQFGLGAAWWFCLGAGASAAWLWLVQRFRRERPV